MTTICWDGYDLATDSQVVEGNCRVENINKIYSLDNGSYLAFCGSADVGQLVSEWINGKREAPSDDLMKESAVLLVDSNGDAYYYDNTVSVAMPVKKCASGSGMQFAYAILDNGGTAEQAVKAAIKRDIYSGGKVNVVHINPRKEKKKKIEIRE